jgi:hypothetical protein
MVVEAGLCFKVGDVVPMGVEDEDVWDGDSDTDTPALKSIGLKAELAVGAKAGLGGNSGGITAGEVGLKVGLAV